MGIEGGYLRTHEPNNAELSLMVMVVSEPLRGLDKMACELVLQYSAEPLIAGDSQYRGGVADMYLQHNGSIISGELDVGNIWMPTSEYLLSYQKRTEARQRTIISSSGILLSDSGY